MSGKKSSTRSKKTGLALAKTVRELAEDKKALNPVILDLRQLRENGEGVPADFFVICGAQVEPQVKAIVNHVEKELKDEHGVAPWSVNGKPVSQWIVMDYGDVFVHVMHEAKRGYYQLEELWNDGKIV